MSRKPKMSSGPLPDQMQTLEAQLMKLNLDDDKRSSNKTGNNTVNLAGVPNWKDYFASLTHKVAASSPATGKKYEVNEQVNSKVSLWKGDITTLATDCIVNAANNSLLGGSGVDGAIHHAAGPQLLKECRELKGCKDGQAKITGGYNLPAKHVIHTVGPRGEKPDLLRSAYLTSLQLMVKNHLRSIAFPCISTGVYGYPQRKAAKVALATVREFVEKNPDKIDRVIFTVFLPQDKAIYEELMPHYFPLK